MHQPIPWNYDRAETIADAVVHGLGIAFAVAGGAALIVVAALYADVSRVTAVAIYSAGLAAMIGFSAAYNLWPLTPVKWWLRRLDHSAIYLLIAATYTAFVLPMRGTAADIILIVQWASAFVGIALKLRFPGRFDRAAIALYLVMGWSGLFVIGPMAAALAPVTLVLIAIGGVLYSAGVVFHVWESLRFQNAIWHGFVLAAAACHYGAVMTSVV
ncbi:MAG: hemolysin III family protein [Proteobacteria bacterium]|nr:hemolysin III family protein [Pseudomonadota bacterium]